MLNSQNGHVEINSTSFNRFNKYSDEEIKIERNLKPPTLTESKAFIEVIEKFNEAFGKLDYEVVKPFDAVQDEEKAWHEYFTKAHSTVWHPVATCKMGIAEDAVVDPSLKVIGVNNLRVVDNSILPVVTHGNTMMPALYVG